MPAAPGTVGIRCDISDIAPVSLLADRTKCDVIVTIKEAQVFGSVGFFTDDEDAVEVLQDHQWIEGGLFLKQGGKRRGFLVQASRAPPGIPLDYGKLKVLYIGRGGLQPCTDRDNFGAMLSASLEDGLVLLEGKGISKKNLFWYTSFVHIPDSKGGGGHREFFVIVLHNVTLSETATHEKYRESLGFSGTGEMYSNKRLPRIG